MSNFPFIRLHFNIYFIYKSFNYGNKYYIVALKTHVNLGFSIKGLTTEEINLFEGTGKTTRHLKIDSQENIDEENIKKLLKIVKDK